MYPNKDGWLSIEATDEQGVRTTLFHGVLQVSSREAREAYRARIAEAVREHRERQRDGRPPPECEPVPLFQGKVVVSLPKAGA
mmetsp:Transcript_25241/g.72785  ORF Transcript_25241/g.72785 Transcript_25241/m.72785 type:complete len:83 (-) Transcript_25241:9-257(-)